MTGPFEDRLLAELRAVVAERPAPHADADPRVPRVPRLRLGLAAGAVAATAAGVLVAGGGGDRTARAFAVERHSDGSVTVEIRSLRDASGLQSKLRAAGIPAVVDYAPAGKACLEPRGRRPRPAPGAPARAAMDVRVRHGDAAEFTISRGDVRAGQTLVLTSSVGASTTSLASEIVEGPVAPCRLVDAPPPPTPGPARIEKGRTAGPRGVSPGAVPSTQTGP